MKRTMVRVISLVLALIFTLGIAYAIIAMIAM